MYVCYIYYVQIYLCFKSLLNEDRKPHFVKYFSIYRNFTDLYLINIISLDAI